MEKQFECVKIKDGLYLGNKLVAFDLEFLIINKFAYIVNCASEVPNLFEEHGLRYLKFKIKHDKNLHIFDEDLKRLKKLKKIVEEAEDSGLCCLIHCNQDGYRSLTLAIAYLMDRFKWRLRKTIEYLQSKGVSIILTDRNIQELTSLEYTLSKQFKLSHLWIGPYVDEEEQLISRTYNNTNLQAKKKQGKNNSPIRKEGKQDEQITVDKTRRRVQWQDRIDKEEKKEKKRLLAERVKEEKKQYQKSREKLDEEAIITRGSKTNAILNPKDKAEGIKKVKKKVDFEVNDAKKKNQEAQILKLLKKSGKLKKQLHLDDSNQNTKEREIQRQDQRPMTKEEKQEEKKVYKFTINNYINPNINIIKPPLDKKKKVKTGTKKDKDKFNRTYSQKEAFKKPIFYGKDASRDKDGSRQKRNPGHTPVRSRKQRKSEKDVIM